MKKLLPLFVCLLGIKASISQIPVSHLPQVTYNASSTAFGANTLNLKDFDLCTTWNAGTYGGWVLIDLHDTIQVTRMNWWIDASPEGNMTELVEVSLDSLTWTQAANTSGPHYQYEEKILLFNASPLNNVRYVRISQSSTPSWFAIRELVINEAYYLNNIYSGMRPKILDINEQLVNTSNINSFPTTVYCSKASTYQWKKNGVNIPGQNTQSLIITSTGNYTCDITYIGGCNRVLPLQLLSFDIKKTNNGATINWRTANEENVDRFEIERSHNGYEFSKVGQVKAGLTTYSFNDNSSAGAIIYYRLKMIDKDGKFTYSKVVSVKQNSMTKTVIFPNPVRSTATIQLQSEYAESIWLKIVGSDGRILTTKTYNLAAGNNLKALNIEHLPSGVYAVVIAGQNKTEHLIFSKQ
jgi:Secretion system C-terminal sorting domain